MKIFLKNGGGLTDLEEGLPGGYSCLKSVLGLKYSIRIIPHLILSACARSKTTSREDFKRFVDLDRTKTAMEKSIRRLSDDKRPTYCRFERITALIIGPRVWPTSIIMLRNPIDVLMRSLDTSSLMRGDVEEMSL